MATGRQIKSAWYRRRSGAGNTSLLVKSSLGAQGSIFATYFFGASTTTHATTGALTGQGSTVAGSATRFTVHATAGLLTGQIGTVAGSAARLRAFSSSGALVGQGSALAGSAARVAATVTHATTAALTGQGSALAGSAARLAAAVTHSTAGILTGPGSSMSGEVLNGTIAPPSVGSGGVRAFLRPFAS